MTNISHNGVRPHNRDPDVGSQGTGRSATMRAPRALLSPHPPHPVPSLSLTRATMSVVLSLYQRYSMSPEMGFCPSGAHTGRGGCRPRAARVWRFLRAATVSRKGLSPVTAACRPASQPI